MFEHAGAALTRSVVTTSQIIILYPTLATWRHQIQLCIFRYETNGFFSVTELCTVFACCK